MISAQRSVLCLVLSLCLVGCWFFDSGTEWKGGSYRLVWIDTAENIGLFREDADGRLVGRIEATVNAVGWDGRYLVAKRRSTPAQFYFIDSSSDADIADPREVVIGPLNELEFKAKVAEFNLPPFSKVLE